MSVIKPGYTRALEAYAGPVIPYPTLITSGTTTSNIANKLVNTAENFLSDGISPGDVVYNDATKTSARVVSIDSNTQLTLSSNLFTSSPEAYRVFKMSDRDTNGNPGCALYAPAAGTISFTTIGGDAITIAVVAGAIIPLQARSITSTSVIGLIALW